MDRYSKPAAVTLPYRTRLLLITGATLLFSLALLGLGSQSSHGINALRRRG